MSVAIRKGATFAVEKGATWGVTGCPALAGVVYLDGGILPTTTNSIVDVNGTPTNKADDFGVGRYDLTNNANNTAATWTLLTDAGRTAHNAATRPVENGESDRSRTTPSARVWVIDYATPGSRKELGVVC